MMIAKRILLTLVLPLIFIGGINFGIDPDYTLRTDYIKPLVQSLQEGKLVSGPVNVNSRLLKKEWINRMSELNNFTF